MYKYNPVTNFVLQDFLNFGAVSQSQLARVSVCNVGHKKAGYN